MFDDFLSNGTWFISRNYSLAVWDEYIPCDSWAGYRKLNDVLSYHIDIYGVHKTNSYGLKPRRWSAKLHYNSFTYNVPTSHPSCKSLHDACKQADKSLTKEIFKNACHWFMSQHLATCIVKEDLTPYCTVFGSPQWHKTYLTYSKPLYPYGRYNYAYRHGDNILFAQSRVFSSGYCSSSTKEALFEHWL